MRTPARPLSVSLARFSHAVVICAAVSLATSSRAADLTWDPDLIPSNGSTGGGGVWDTSASQWIDAATGVPWSNAANHNAIFGGVGGTVALGVPVTAGGLRFEANGYSITNNSNPLNVLTLSGPSPAVSVVDAAHLATITSSLTASSGFSKTGAGTLLLNSGGNTIGGPINLTGGTLAFTAGNQLGSAGRINLSNSATLSYQAGGEWLTGSTVFDLGASGGTLHSTAPIRMMADGQLTGSGTLIRTAPSTSYGLDIRGNNSGFTGNVVIQSGTLELQSSNALGTGTNPNQTITVDAGILSITKDISQKVVLNGGTLAFNNASTSSYKGAVELTADSRVQLADFYQSVGRSGTIAGPISGNHNLTVTSPSSSFQTLTLKGSTTGLTGDLIIDNNAVVSASAGVAGGTGTIGNYNVQLNGGILQVTPAIGSNPLPGQAAGLVGQYYNQGVAVHNNNTGNVDFSSPNAVRIDDDLRLPSLNVSNNRGGSEGVPWNIGRPNGTNIEDFAAQWTGLINITQGGDYTFVSSSDDATVVIIDGVRVVTNEGGHAFPGSGHRGSTVNLTPGLHSITVRLTQGTGGAGLLVAYEGPDQPIPVPNPFPTTGYDVATLVPASVLSHATVAGSISNNFSIPDFLSGGIDAAGLDLTSTGNVSLGFLSTLRLGSTTGHSVIQTGNIVLNGNATISTQLSNSGTAANSEISGVISQNSSATQYRLTKEGFGTLTLSGANTFGGPLDIMQGHVAGTTNSLNTDISLSPDTSVIFNQATDGVYNKAISSFGSGLVVKRGTGAIDFTQNMAASIRVDGGIATVGNGLSGDATVNHGGTLRVGGGVNGNATVNGGELTVLQPTGSAFQVGSLTLNGGKINLTVPGTIPSYPLVDSFGQLTVGKSTMLNLGGTQSAGVYKLVDYTGTGLTPEQFNGVILGSVPTGNFYGVLINNTAGTSLDYAVEAFGAANSWTGQTSGVWDTATATNWNSGAFASGQQVTFGDSGVNKTLTGSAVSPQRITFNNTAGNDYSISNQITGTLAGGIVKTGSGTATLSGQVSSAGAVDVSGGTLRLTNTSTASPNSISGRWMVASGGTVEAAFGGTRTGTTDPSGSSSLGNAVVDLNGGTLLLSGKDYDGGAGGLMTHLYTQQVQRNARAELRSLSGMNALFNTSTPDTLAAPNTGLTDVLSVVDFANGYGTAAPFGSLGLSATDNIMATWRGQFIAPSEGTYTFTGRSDDGMVVYINGQLVLDRNNFQGATNTTATVTLTEGRHDIYVAYYEGSSNGGVQLFKDAAGTQVYGPESFAAAQPLTTLGNNVLWNASSTVAADNTHGVVLGNLSANTPGTTLTSGRVRVAGQASADGIVRFADTDFNAPGTYTFNAQADIGLGTIRDGGKVITLVKTGPGNLILDSDGSTVESNGTTISIQEGRLVASRTGAGNPLGNAAIRLDADGTVLQFNRTEAVSGTSTFVNPISVNANARIETARHGGASSDFVLGNIGTGITIANGKTLEMHATSGGNVYIDGPITGNGTVTISGGNDPGQSQGFVLLRAANTFSGPLIVENGGNVRIDHAQALGTQAYVSLDTNARLELYAGNSFTSATPRILSKPGSYFRINANTNPAVTIGGGTLEIGPGRILEMQSGNPYTGGGTIARAINSYYGITGTIMPFSVATTQVGLRAIDVRPLDVLRVTTTVNSPGQGVLDAGLGAMTAGSVIQLMNGDRNISNLAVQEINGQIITNDGSARSVVDSAGIHINEKGAVFAASGGTLTVFENIQTDANSGRITIGAHIPIDNRFSNMIVSFANGTGGVGDFTGTSSSLDKAVEVIGGASLESRVSASGDSGLGTASAPSIGVNLARGSLRAYQPTGNLSTAGTYSVSAGKVFATGAATLYVNRNTNNAGVITELRIGSEIERSAGATIGLVSQNNSLGAGERIRFINNADAPDRVSAGGNTINMVAPHFVNATSNIGSFVDYDPAQDPVTGPGFVNAVYENAAAETDFGAGKIINTTGSIALTADQTAAAIRLQGALTGGFTLTSETGGFILTSSGSTNHNIQANLAAAPGKEFVIYSGGASGGLHTLSGTVTSDSGFVKFGPRTLTLGADNSATLVGDIYINEGSLVVAGDNRLGDPSNKVVLNGGNLRPSQSFVIPRQIVVNAGGGQLTNDANRDVEYSGTISGEGGLTINSVNGNNGVNRLTSPDGNTFEGGLIISNGVVEFTRNDQLGALPDPADYDRGHVVINDSNTNATLRLAAGAGEVSTGARQFTLLGAGAKIEVPGVGDRLTIANDIRGTGGLNKGGVGVLALTNPEGNGYIGNTVVNEGTLLVNSAQFSATGAGTVTVNSGATLAGKAVIEGAITIASGATLAPGESLGAGISGELRAQNGVSLEENAVLEWSLSALSTSNPGVNFDRLIVDNGALNVAAGADIRVNFGLGIAPSADAFWAANHVWSDVIQVISLGTIATAGAFDIDNSAWAQFGSFSAVPDEDGYDLIWTTAVPEPTSAVTLLAGLGGLLGMRRYRRKE